MNFKNVAHKTFEDVAHKTVAELFDMLKEKHQEVDSLKAQLNNMETCYIEKKKQVDELQNRINEVLEDLEYPTAPWDETIASVIGVLRGDND